MHPGMPFWPGGVPFVMTRLVDYDQGYRLHEFAMGENTGTHVDAPAREESGAMVVDTSCSAVTFRFLDEEERARIKEQEEARKKGRK